MKLKVANLDPHFIKRASKLSYELTDSIAEAEGIFLQCPACHWANRHFGKDEPAHMIVLWGDPKRWHFVGHDYKDVSMLAGRLKVAMSGGACRTRFTIKDGKVDFSEEERSFGDD